MLTPAKRLSGWFLCGYGEEMIKVARVPSFFREMKDTKSGQKVCTLYM